MSPFCFPTLTVPTPIPQVPSVWRRSPPESPILPLESSLYLSSRGLLWLQLACGLIMSTGQQHLGSLGHNHSESSFEEFLDWVNWGGKLTVRSQKIKIIINTFLKRRKQAESQHLLFLKANTMWLAPSDSSHPMPSQIHRSVLSSCELKHTLVSTPFSCWVFYHSKKKSVKCDWL